MPNTAPSNHQRYLKHFGIAFVLLAIVTLFWARTDLFPTINGCYGKAYDDDHYMAYCQSKRYGDYEHGAAALALEPGFIEGAKAAEVLMLGNSRTQYAFSTQAVDRFFTERDWPYYVFGFGFDAQSNFPNFLFQHHEISPKAVIVNADPFFSPWPTPLSRRMATESETWLAWEYQTKQQQQPWHAELCTQENWLSQFFCGRAPTIYRARSNGMWLTKYYRPDHHHRVAEDDSLLDRLPNSIEVAKAFMQTHQLPPECVILTVTPQQSTPVAFAQQLAGQLGTPFVYPRLDELYTVDKEHLDPPSAERFSDAFLQQAAPWLERCLSGA